MDTVLLVLQWFLVLSGGFFLSVGALGVLRFPDFFTRLHAAGVTDTFGAGLMILAMMIEAGFTLIAVKLFLILLFLLLTSPTSSHALAKAARHGGLRPSSEPPGENPSKL